MKRSTFKQHLNRLSDINFVLPNGTFIPKHLHVTEAGLVTKNLIDCGGTVRDEKVTNLHVWIANDAEHRLESGKLLKIISLQTDCLAKDNCGIPQDKNQLQLAELETSNSYCTPGGGCC